MSKEGHPETIHNSAVRIVILAGQLHPVGGIETHIFHYCEFAAASLGEVSLFVTSCAYSSVSKRKLLEQHIEVKEFDCARPMLIKGAIGYARCLQHLFRCRGGRTLLYSHGTSGFSYLAGKLLKPRVWVHHHHGDILQRTFCEFSQLYGETLRSATWIIACTPDHARLIDSYYSRGGRTVCLPYLKAEPARLEINRHGTNSKKIVLGFFGRLRQSKGVLTLISLAPWFVEHGLECRLHGDDCEGLMKVPLPTGITWLGAYDSSADLDRLLKDVDIVVLPTTFPEGLPIVMSEAISRGVPVVAYAGGGLREMQGFHPGIMIVQGDRIDEFKKSILEMGARLENPELRRSLASKYRESLGNQKTAAWWLEIINSHSFGGLKTLLKWNAIRE